MPLYDEITLPTDVDRVRTVDNAGKDKNLDQPLTRTGLGGKASKARDTEWKTTVTWDPIEPTCKDGTGVEATILGPDHKAGETPDKSIYVCPNVIWLNQIAGLDSNRGYVKGHLLNEKLGGPGNDCHNLTAIPRSTNTGGMKDHVEERMKALVNTARAWVYFKAKVTHTKVAGTEDVKEHIYASKLDFAWHELKDDGAGNPVKVDGTEGTVSLDVPPPDEYKDTDYSKPSDTRTYGATKTGKSDAKPDDTSAIADLPWNAIVLQDWDTAKKRADVMKIAKVEIMSIGAEDAKRIVDYLTEEHAPKEVELFQWLRDEVERLQKDERAKPSDDLAGKLDAYDQARGLRIKQVTDNVARFLDDKKCDEALRRAQRFRDELVKHDPLAPYRGLVGELLRRNQQLGKDKSELQDRVIDLGLGFEAPMSPFSEWQVSEDIDPGETEQEKEKGVVDLDERRKRVREHKLKEKPTKSSKDLFGQKPTRMAERTMYVLDELRKGKTVPPGFDALKSIDEFAHTLLCSYITADNLLCTRDMVWPWLRGFERDRSDVFVTLTLALSRLPSLVDLYRAALDHVV